MRRGGGRYDTGSFPKKPEPRVPDSANDLEALLPVVIGLVNDAGAAILEVYATAFAVEYKADRSPITVADRAAHDLLSAGLSRLTPGIPVLSEEGAEHHGQDIRGQWREFWLVDPLDGTKEFLSRNGEFTVNVALIRDHRPVLGVVGAPVPGLLYYGAAGLGAYCVKSGGAPVPIHVRSAASPLVVVGSRSHRGDSLDDVLARLGAHDLRPMGSSLKFCLVAEGEADFYPRLGPTSEWDTAAAQAVLEAAGGAVITLDGDPLRYNERETLLNPQFLAVGDTSLDWRRLF
jgi:3'(2'), 5'-bisphosphate nucleotidase